MKKHVKVVIFTLFLLCVISTLHAAQKNEAAVIVTGDIREDYEVIGIVSAKHIRGVAEVTAELSKVASGMGADYVINTDYFGHQSQLHAVGTAVKLKDDEETAQTE